MGMGGAVGPSLTRGELELARARLALARSVRARRAAIPSEWYVPSVPTKDRPYANQRGFHEAPHAIRLLVPGNGWGKTTAMGAEAQAWAMHTNEFQPTPSWPLLMLWFCKLRDQFELVRVQLRETIIGSSARWVDDSFVWPDGSRLWIGSADRSTDWRKWQGVPADLILFDEQPPRSLWREMTMRRRGKRKTRLVIGATATEGESWMEGELYRPWLQHHQDQGLDEDRALFAQTHERIWVWSRGGIEDNPGADDEDIAWYDYSTSLMHPKERQVRRRGGFATWVGDGVFDSEAMEVLEQLAQSANEKRGGSMLGMFVPA